MFEFIEDITCNTPVYYINQDRVICPRHKTVMHPQRVRLHSKSRKNDDISFEFIMYACDRCNKLVLNQKKKEWLISELDKRKMSMRLLELAQEDDEPKKNIIHDNGKKDNKVGYFDTIVLSTIRYCTNKKHTIEPVLVDIDVISREGHIKSQSIFAAYCKQCKRYYILKMDYKKMDGIPLCDVRSEEKNISISKENNPYNLHQESIIHRYGYNVNSVDNLTSTQRRLILRFIVENKVLSTSEICSHLDYLIKRSKNAKGLNGAVNKWKSDRKYIEQLQVTPVKHIKAKSICIK